MRGMRPVNFNKMTNLKFGSRKTATIKTESFDKTPKEELIIEGTPQQTSYLKKHLAKEHPSTKGRSYVKDDDYEEYKYKKVEDFVSYKYGLKNTHVEKATKLEDGREVIKVTSDDGDLQVVLHKNDSIIEDAEEKRHPFINKESVHFNPEKFKNDFPSVRSKSSKTAYETKIYDKKGHYEKSEWSAKKEDDRDLRDHFRMRDDDATINKAIKEGKKDEKQGFFNKKTAKAYSDYKKKSNEYDEKKNDGKLYRDGKWWTPKDYDKKYLPHLKVKDKVRNDKLFKSLKGDDNDSKLEKLEDKYHVDLTSFYGNDYDDASARNDLADEIVRHQPKEKPHLKTINKDFKITHVKKLEVNDKVKESNKKINFGFGDKVGRVVRKDNNSVLVDFKGDKQEFQGRELKKQINIKKEDTKTKNTWFKVRDGKQTKINKPSDAEKESLLNQKYVVSKVTESGNKTKVFNYSPDTRLQNFEKRKKQEIKKKG